MKFFFVLLFFLHWLLYFSHIFFIQVLQATLMKQMELEATLEALKDSINRVSRNKLKCVLMSVFHHV